MADQNQKQDGQDPQQDQKQKSNDEEEALITFKSSSSANTNTPYQRKFDDDKYIWEYEELQEINKLREPEEEFDIIQRNQFQKFGIRAHQSLTFSKCSYTLIVPQHNEFVNIWILIAFAIYFWVQLILISARVTKFYDFNNNADYLLMFIATLGIAVSITTTIFYYLYYSMSRKVFIQLENYNLQGILFMAYGLLFAFIASEWKNQIPIYFYSLFFTGIFLFVSLALIQYEAMRIPVLLMTATYFFLILIIDLSLYVTRKQVGIFYLPMLIETLILLIGIVLLFFGLPERLFPQSKVINLYFSSSILFTILMVNFLFETQVILYYTFKSNSNYLTNEGEWWDLKNIYNN